MDVANLSPIINKAALEALGANAVTVTDTSSLVSLGDVVMATDTNVDVFWRKLADRIGRVDNKYKALKRADRFTSARSELEWGMALQKNQVRHIRETEASASWSTTQTDPYRYNDVTDFTSTIYSKIGAFQTKPVVAPRNQLKRTFLNFSEMGSFLSLLDNDMNNAFTMAVNNLERTARNVALEIAFRDGNKVNVGKEYNQNKLSSWEAVTNANYRYNDNFWRYFAERVKAYKKWLTDDTQPTRLFNGIGADRWTDTDALRFDVLAGVASAIETYMLSDTYHKEIVELKGYREVRAWQGTGNTLSMADAGKVYVELENDESENITPVERENVLAFIYDKDRVGTLVRDERVLSWYNPDAERQTTKKCAETGYYCDRSEQGVVFYVDVNEE